MLTHIVCTPKQMNRTSCGKEWTGGATNTSGSRTPAHRLCGRQVWFRKDIRPFRTFTRPDDDIENCSMVTPGTRDNKTKGDPGLMLSDSSFMTMAVTHLSFFEIYCFLLILF